MYVPAHFAMTDAQIQDVLLRMGSADLVTHHESGLLATPLPFVFDASIGAHGALLGHVARNNRQWSEPTTCESLVVVTLTDHYVSPAVLPSTREHGRVVPTWDYVTVHVYGDLVAHDDLDWTSQVVRRLTEKHEGRTPVGSGPASAESAQPVGWTVDDAAPGYVEAMLRAIVGLELRITRIEAKAKMAQNKAPADVVALAELLAAQGDAEGERWLREVSLPAAQTRADTLSALRHRT